MNRINSLLFLFLVGCGGQEPANEGSASGAAAGEVAFPGAQHTTAVGQPVDAKEAREKQAAQELAAQRVEAAPTLTQTFKHDLGFYFKYPEDWKLSPAADRVLSLTPSDVHMNNGLETEAFLVMGDTANGLTDPNDPRGIQAAELIVQQLLPFLRRVGGIEQRSFAKHNGVVISWEGTNSHRIECRARLWVTIMNTYAIGILAVTPKDRFAGREQVVEDMFSTFGFTESKDDSRLVGQWRHEKVFMSGDFSTVTTQYVRLNADQTCAWSSSLMANGASRDAGGNTTGGYGADSGESGARGTWKTNGRTITLSWNGAGSQNWEYYVDGASLLLKSNGDKKLWERVR